MKIFLVRHGETTYNKETRFQGQQDAPLTPNGQSQAGAVADRFEKAEKSGEHFDAIYSSPLSRCMDTADAIGSKLNMKPVTEPGLKEMRMGEWESKTPGEVKEQYRTAEGKPLMSEWMSDPVSNKVPGGETVDDVEKRVVATLDKIIKENRQDANVVLVTHGGPISVILCKVLDQSLKEANKKHIANTSVTVLDVKKDLSDAKLLSENDTSHMEAYIATLPNVKAY
ncbi:MAG: histidine phosphatase family protein [Vulcanimicrobiota bacterium]